MPMFPTDGKCDRLYAALFAFGVASEPVFFRLLVFIAEKNRGYEEFFELVQFPKAMIQRALMSLENAGLIEDCPPEDEAEYRVTQAGREIILAASNIASLPQENITT